MVTIIDTSKLRLGVSGVEEGQHIYDGLPLSPDDKHYVYCALDSCITNEILQKIIHNQDEETSIIYDFERACLAPALEISLRGILIDKYAQSMMLHSYIKDSIKTGNIVNRYSQVMAGIDLNPNSHVQLKKFFYEIMNVPEIYTYEKGERKLKMNRDTLEQITNYFHARPIANAIMAFRDTQKKISVLKSEVDADGRMRFSLNVGGTETGRLSCSLSSFGRGTSGQNITDELRAIFIADKGYKFAYPDLEHAESYIVAYESGDKNYIAACESEDPHTIVARMVWPELPWTGDLHKDRKIAERKFYRHFTYRDMAKKGGHAFNYYGQPYTISKQLKVPQSVLEAFEKAYFKAFPGIRIWHQRIATEIQTKGYLITPLGRKRYFLGRKNDPATLRKAIAYIPQSTVGEIMNLGMWRIWKYQPDIQLLMNMHDGVLVQYPDVSHEKEVEYIEKLREMLTVKIPYKGSKPIIIPIDFKTGWNWAEHEKEYARSTNTNPDSLMKYIGEDKREREVWPDTPLLQRRVH